MGWDGYEVTIGITVDSHGGRREVEERKKTLQFIKELEVLAEKYSDVVVMVSYHLDFNERSVEEAERNLSD